jgi:hypothetical protein
MDLVHGRKVRAKRRFHPFGQHGHAIFSAFSVAHSDLMAVEVEVFHPKLRALEDAQARAVEQSGHQRWHAVHLVEDGADFVARQHHGQAVGPLCVDQPGQPGELAADHSLIPSMTLELARSASSFHSSTGNTESRRGRAPAAFRATPD